MSHVGIIGAGPSGTIAALSLLQLGHQVTLFEKDAMPRYRVGESFMPATLSILNRLGLSDEVDARFVHKPSVTFWWGSDRAPWTLSFAAPKAHEWSMGYAFQADRASFDKFLLDAATEAGATVHSGVAVRRAIPSSQSVVIETTEGEQAPVFDYVIDASGNSGVAAKTLAKRRYDAYFKAYALWGYFDMADPFEGSLRGTTLSFTFDRGWCWLIPVRPDRYSIGFVVDKSSLSGDGVDHQSLFESFIRAVPRVRDFVGTSAQVGKVRLTSDWSYNSPVKSAGRIFAVGDAACFTDPMFGQGVHLGAQSAVRAAAAIDLLDTGASSLEAVHAWYGLAYQASYEQYYEFIVSFYSLAAEYELGSSFWDARRLENLEDSRLQELAWVRARKASGQPLSMEGFLERVRSLAATGEHARPVLSDEFSSNELMGSRMRWLVQRNGALRKIDRLLRLEVDLRLENYFLVDPKTFRATSAFVLSSAGGEYLSRWVVDEAQGVALVGLLDEELSYAAFTRRFGELGLEGDAGDFIADAVLFGVSRALDATGEVVDVPQRLHFDAVGSSYGV